MSVFLVHGFKWARNEIRVHVVLQEVDDAAPNNLMSGESEEAMNENFRDLYPGPMAKLPPLRFIEPLNANNEKFKYPSEPYAFVVDAVVQSEDWIDVTDAMNKAHIPASQWDAMADLRDIIARGEKIGWFVVHNGDRELAKQERLRKEANGFQTSADETEAAEQAEAIESKYSKELGEKVAKMQLPNKSNGKEEVKDAPHQLCIWQMTDFKGTDLTANRQETWEIQEAFPRRFEMKPWKILIIVPRWCRIAPRRRLVQHQQIMGEMSTKGASGIRMMRLLFLSKAAC